MGRFRRSGTNWEGRKWSTCKSLNALMDEVEAAFPTPRSLDGTVASKGHDQNNPSSDHRPRPFTGTGVVRAVDIGEAEPEGDVIAEAIRAVKDPRIKYVIHERRIFSSYNHANGKAWTWRPYSGYNAHLTHVHVSVNTNNQNDGSAWNLGLGGDMAALQVIDLQKALNKAGMTDMNGKKLVEDDIYGAKTEAAFIKGLQGGSVDLSAYVKKNTTVKIV